MLQSDENSRKGGCAVNVEWKDWFWRVWENNRRLTDRVAQAFMDAGAMDQTPVPGMRPFRKLLLEVWGIEQVYARGFALEDWRWEFLPESYGTCAIEEAMAVGASVREETRRLWPMISAESLTEARPTPFPGHPEGGGIEWLTYALENEIHHRGQGYVYLRLLGKEPPAFYLRTDSKEGNR